MKAVQNKLMSVQTQIKAPKDMYNSFGKYKYRNFESICEAAKPYLIQQNCTLTVSDEVVLVGTRIYVKATAIFTDCESGESVSVSAMAREPEDKKGMDASQITGTASSYARKYAVNGLFLLDDTKDADTDEYHNETMNRGKSYSQPAPPPTLSAGATAVRNDELSMAIATAQQNIASGKLDPRSIDKAQSYIAAKDLKGLINFNNWFATANA